MLGVPKRQGVLAAALLKFQQSIGACGVEQSIERLTILKNRGYERLPNQID
jgi:hypothetical protein